ncbi:MULTISPECIES: acylphosphatase [unclassified Archaeoglobus]|jgi:acylphosphatase|uniref:acylphosphatase n=1 Tax=unclassified Archaeoglobus TaxID=2643606 RepID=UPI0025C0C28B|nr:MULTISPECIES: acylphosphatase [unclassified Archaeoglobus]
MKLKAVIRGKVHGVGYRVALINMALEYGIDRFAAFNVVLDGKEALIVLIDAPEEIAEILKARIKSEKPEKAVVESISFEEYKYEVPPIERCIQTFQMEHWGRAIPILLEMLNKQDKMLEKQDLMLEKQDKMLEKQDAMLEKQDSTIKAIREESEKTRAELGGKIDLLRSDLKEYMESNLRRIREEIAEIREALRKAGIM